jgi:hypothetical protein
MRYLHALVRIADLGQSLERFCGKPGRAPAPWEPRASRPKTRAW